MEKSIIKKSIIKKFIIEKSIVKKPMKRTYWCCLIAISMAVNLCGCVLPLGVKWDQFTYPKRIATETITGDKIREPIPSELTTYYKLSEEEQAIYRCVRDGIASCAEQIEFFPTVDEDVLDKCINCVYTDYPEYHWFDFAYTYWEIEETNQVSSIEPEYIMTKEQILESAPVIQANTRKLLAEMPIDGTDYEKAKYLYEALITFTEYVDDSDYNQTMASVFLNGESVCSGYAKAMQYLLLEAGISSTYIGGEAFYIEDEVEKWDSHAWNMVQLDGEYYYIDATWGDPDAAEEYQEKAVEYGYLCGFPQEFENEHIGEFPVELPECVMDDLEYYRLNQLRYDAFSYDDICRQMVERTQAGHTYMEFAFETEEDYNMMLTELLDADLADEACEARAELINAEMVYYDVISDDSLRCIEFWWMQE